MAGNTIASGSGSARRPDGSENAILQGTPLRNAFITGHPGATDFHVQGIVRIRTRSKLPARTIESVRISLTGRTTVRFKNPTSFPYGILCDESVHLSLTEELALPRSPFVIPDPTASAEGGDGTSIELPFSIEVPVQMAIRNLVLPSRFISTLNMDLPSTIVTPAGKRLYTEGGDFVTETWYVACELGEAVQFHKSDVFSTLHLGSQSFTTEPIRIEVNPVLPEIVQAYTRPATTVNERMPQSDRLFKCRFSSVLETSKKVVMVISCGKDPGATNLVPEGKQRDKQVVSAVRVDVMQKIEAVARGHTAVTEIKVASYSVPHYILTDLDKPQTISFPHSATATSCWKPPVKISYGVKVHVTRASTSFFQQQKSVITLSAPLVVTRFSRELAHSATVDSPWLLLPPDGGEGGGGDVGSVPIPPQAWRVMGDVDGELPAYAASG
ncbi:hypothetical protein HK101_000319 [Irineochytrium annulatum]|nr:hypothetical protein HK101_000319 [Irineochytrium annulatum]